MSDILHKERVSDEAMHMVSKLIDKDPALYFLTLSVS